MGYKNDDYEEDVFSLEEDLDRERKKQFVQYIIVAAFAALVVVLALYASVFLTQKRIEDQKNVTANPPAKTETTITPVDAQSNNFWPSEQYPDVPVLEAAGYETTVGQGSAVVEVPAQTAESFADYAQKLVGQGAALYIDSERLKVLNLNGVEIHLVDTNARTAVVLCQETAYNWSDSTYSAFTLPESGRLVKVENGAGADSRVLTYRGATTLDALDYVKMLIDSGWTLSGSLEPTENIFLAVLKKNNLQITVDYFSGGDAYLVRLDYLS